PALFVADDNDARHWKYAPADATHARLSDGKLIPRNRSGQSLDQERPVDAHHWSTTPAARQTAGASAAGTGPALRRTSWRPETVTVSSWGSRPLKAIGARSLTASQAERAARSEP